MQYDASVIEQLADNLYKQAASIERTMAMLGFATGFVVGAVATAPSGEAAYMAVGGLVMAIIGTVLGLSAARARAFALRCQAQQLLCQVQIEKNTRATAEALLRPAQRSA